MLPVQAEVRAQFVRSRVRHEPPEGPRMGRQGDETPAGLQPQLQVCFLDTAVSCTSGRMVCIHRTKHLRDASNASRTAVPLFVRFSSALGMAN